MMLLTGGGVRTRPRSSLDWQCRTFLDQIKPSIRIHSPAVGEYGSVLRIQASMKALSLIASNKANPAGTQVFGLGGNRLAAIDSQRHDPIAGRATEPTAQLRPNRLNIDAA